jgi:hypothetical protein
MSLPKEAVFAIMIDGLDDSEKRSVRKMVLDSFTACEMAAYLISNWGDAAASKVAREIQKTVKSDLRKMKDEV